LFLIVEQHHKNNVWDPTIGIKLVDVKVGEEPISEEQDVWFETKPAWDEQVLVKDAYEEQILVREAYDEQVLVSPEEGHWEPVKDEEKPENPEQKPDEQTPEKPDNSNTDNKQDSTEDTSKDKTDNKADNKTDSKKEDTNTAPKTGDSTNLAYLATLAGSALVGGVSWKCRKRK